MANRKISDLTALTAPATGDLLPIVDISEAAAADKNKKITYGELLASAPAGSAAAPSFSFDSDPNSGIYSSGADQISFATNGTERFRVDSAGQLEAVSLGTAAAPTFSFTGDPNTGIYSPGADQVAISTNGTGRLFIASDGKIGLNVASPTQAQLVVASSAGANTAFFTDGTNSSIKFLHGGGGAIITTESGQYLGFGTSDTERMRLTSAGLLGLGTSAPGSPLTIAGNYTGTSNMLELRTTAGGVDGGGRIVWKKPQDEFLNSFISSSRVGATSAGQIEFGTAADIYTANATTKMVITGSGAVGIGTTAPVGTLHIVGDTSTLGEYSVLSVADVSDTTKAVRIAYDDVNDVGVITASDTGTSWKNLVLQPVEGRVGIRTTSPGAALEVNAVAATSPFIAKINTAEVARIDSSGRLLVGTSTAYGQNYLQIQGDQANGPSGYGGISLRRGVAPSSIGDGSQLGFIDFGPNDGGVGARISAWGDLLNGTNDYPSRLVFSTTADGASSPTERMRISSGGRTTIKGGGTSDADLAINVTDSADAALLNVRNDGVIGTGNAANSPYNLTTANAANLHVASGGVLYRSTSSLKYKDNVQDAVHGLAELMLLRPVTYTGKSKSDGSVVFGGLIAEEVAAAGLSEFVQYSDDGSPDALAYGNMVSLCVKAIQEQQVIISELQAEVAALKGE